MCSAFRSLAIVLWFVSTALAAQPATQPLVLHIAADPNNLPFSNEKREGFENKIAQLIADDLGATIDYTWWAQRRGFFREAVKHGESEIVMGVPTQLERTVPTRPYYRSTYVFVAQKDRNLGDMNSFDDPRLRDLKIGVTLVGGSNNPPPGQALANRGIVNNVVGYSIYNVDYRLPNPTSKIIEDVAAGKIDVAIVWGPLGGYFANLQQQTAQTPMTVTPVSAESEASTPFAYSISIGLKRSIAASGMKERINEVLARRQEEIDRILDEYHVPRVPRTEAR